MPAKRKLKTQKRQDDAPKPRRKRRTQHNINVVELIQKEGCEGTKFVKTAKVTMSQMIDDLLNAIAAQAIELTEKSRRKVVQAKDVMTAIKMMFPPSATKDARNSLAGVAIDAANTNLELLAQSSALKRITKLQVKKVKQALKHQDIQKSSKEAVVALAGAVYHVAAEIIEGACDATKKDNSMITPACIRTVVENDPELSQLNAIQGAIARAGVDPKIHPALLPPKTGKKGGSCAEL